LVAKVTSLCCHVESCHKVSNILIGRMLASWHCLLQAKYDLWCLKNNFESKLPKAIKSRKEAQAAVEDAKQLMLHPHLKEQPPLETYVAYSDALFREAAIEWLVSTDQVCIFTLSTTWTEFFSANSSAWTSDISQNDQHCSLLHEQHQYSQ